MTIEEAIKKLDENIPETTNKMVDLEHLPISIAWKTVKEELEQVRKETARDILDAIEKQYQKDNKKTYQDVTTYRCQLARRTETKTETWTRHKGYLSGLYSVEMMIKEKYGVEVEE